MPEARDSPNPGNRGPHRAVPSASLPAHLAPSLSPGYGVQPRRQGLTDGSWDKRIARMQRLTSAVFRVGVETVARLILVMALALLAAACNQTGLTPSPVPNPVTGQNPGDVKYYPSDQPVRLGTQRFYDGNFGLAQQYFQDAVEKSPEDVMAWIGLAASYDRLGRFDLADHAYGAAAKLEGETPRLLNNEGYSYMLRGDLKAARAKFKQALRLDPNNQTTLNNIKLLNSSQNFIDRSPSGEPCGSVDCGQ
jgi:tetratricopeptide (TPR) repeat protein